MTCSSRPRWPKSAPILSPRHLRQGKVLYDWLKLSFADPAAQAEFASVLMRLTRRYWGYYGLPPSWVPLSEQAGLWNKALQECGYDVPSEACQVLGLAGYRNRSPVKEEDR